MTQVEPGLRFRAVGTPGPGLREAWAAVWLAASNAGGAIGFSGQVEAHEVAAMVDRELAAAAAGTSTIGFVAGDDEVPVAFAVLQRPVSQLQQHWGLLIRVMVDPGRQGQGIGRLVVEGAQDLARERGLRQVRLTARAGLGLENFYAGLGYQVIGRHPDAIRVGPDEFRDEITLLRTL
jgi:GNAT superfamily N-acetyltransferase